jgi:hypothetical protein
MPARLHLSAMVDAIVIPDDGEGTRLSLTAINRGTEPTILTHMVMFTLTSRWQETRQPASQTFYRVGARETEAGSKRQH